MKTITTTAVVALMTATIGISAAAPTFAQGMAPPHGPLQHQGKGPGHDDRRGPGRDAGGMRGLLNLTNPDTVEIALVRLSQRVDLTPEQEPLFDAFKTAAMAAAEDFSGVLDSVRPAAPAAGQMPERPEIGEMLANRIAITSAQLAALEAVQPSAAAFFDSLTEEQKTALMPQPDDRGRWSRTPMTLPAPATPPPSATNG